MLNMINIFKNSLLFSILLLCFSCSNEQEDGTKKLNKAEESPLPLTNWDSSVMFFSGLGNTKELVLDFPFDTLFYRMNSDSMNSNLHDIRINRLDKMTKWFKEILRKNKVQPDLPVFYPFSGGDFIHMHALYPDANSYLMLALEPVGTFPDFTKLAPNEQDTALLEGANLLRDIFKRSYFITWNMEKDIKNNTFLKGILPTVLWGMAVTNHIILNVQSITLDGNGEYKYTRINPGETCGIGVKIEFSQKGSNQKKELIYFSADVSNSGLNRNKALSAYLNSLPPQNSFVKAASYLMHFPDFSKIREHILRLSQGYLQDDTGIPFASFDKSKFSIHLYGDYVEPVADFSSDMYQADLKNAYADSSFYEGPLPFSLGYHWGSKKQNQMFVYKLN